VRRIWRIIAGIFVLTAPAAVSADNATTNLEASAQAFMHANHIPGMAIAVTNRDGTLVTLYLGSADLKTGKPVTAATLFGVGSITKSMTAVALLQARDLGAFDPEKPVTDYLPYFRVHTAYRPIIGRDLLNHTSGLPDGTRDDMTGEYLVHALRDVETGFAPGTHWSYSNNGYYTLGYMLEHIDQRTYPEIIRDDIFRALDMTDSEPATTYDARDRMAVGYLNEFDDRPPSPDLPVVEAPFYEADWPDGAVLSTAADMAKYIRFLLNKGAGPHGRVLSASSFALLTTPSATVGTVGAGGTGGLYTKYAFGLAVHTIDGHAVVGHTGGTQPYTACMEADLDGGFGAVALTNFGYTAPRPCAVVEYALAIERALADGKPLPTPLPEQKPADQLIVKMPARYAGAFTATDGEQLEFDAAGDRLFLRTAAGQSPMYPEDSDAFWVGDPRFSLYFLRFARDHAGLYSEVDNGSKRYFAAAYTGSKSTAHPPPWDAFTGHYRSVETNWGNNFRVFVRAATLWIETPDGGETELIPLANGEFRIGTDSWSPERISFDTVVARHALRAVVSGGPAYRVFTP
jgi:CubicO group peptidase (beta-lactamase class C family)